jgi:ribonuclease HI
VKIVVWTDGSCNASGMHGRGGWAALIEQAGSVREISGSARGTTHNRMELSAVCEALETLTGAIEVRTDSTYVEKCFNQNWHERWLRDGSWKGSNGRPVKNRDLWERLFCSVWADGRRDVTFEWIKRGSEPNNQRVDRLAREAALSAAPQLAAADALVLAELAATLDVAPAVVPAKSRAPKLAPWKAFPPAEKAVHLLSHITIADCQWALGVPRLPGERRGDFIGRVCV